jgi:hypothetical protein
MKPENSAESDAALSNLLGAWRVNEPLPPRFREQVWQSIARKEAEAPEAIWTTFANWVAHSIAKPSLAVSYVTLLLLAGLFAGYLHARADSARVSEELGTRYVQMLDPYQTQHR